MTPLIALTLGLAAVAVTAARLVLRCCQRRAQRRAHLADMLDTMSED